METPSTTLEQLAARFAQQNANLEHVKHTLGSLAETTILDLPKGWLEELDQLAESTKTVQAAAKARHSAASAPFHPGALRV